jgi:uncharacterized protein YegP (UPF0339 family)
MKVAKKKSRQTKRDESEATLYSEQTRAGRFECYDAADGVRWRLRANNGRIVCDSGEGYTSYKKALQGASRCVKIFVACSEKVTG